MQRPSSPLSRSVLLLGCLALPGCNEILGLGAITFYPDDGGSGDAGASDAARYIDVGPIDAGLPPEEAPNVIAPVNGANTGSPHVPDGTPIHPLRPRLFFLPVTGAHEYELQMDDSCPVAGFRDCTFASPELDERLGATPAASGSAVVVAPGAPLPVSMTPPVGTRYVWRLRGCNFAGCGPWSEPRYLNVGRQNTDYNGDGYADVAIGAPGGTYGNLGGGPPVARLGGIYLYHGGPAVSVVPTTTIPSPGSTWDNFGSALGPADFNGDGYADLAVGAFAFSDSPAELYEGHVFIYSGTSAGLTATPSIVLDSPNDRTLAAFGYGVAAAEDLDGDGFADLGVSAPGEPTSGGVFIYYGSTLGIADAPDALLSEPDAVEGSYFGNGRIAVGDVDGDGLSDLIIGATRRDNGAINPGSMFVFHGSGTRSIGEPMRIDHPLSEPSLGGFGGNPTAGVDLNGDGYGDMACGPAALPFLGTADDKVFVYLGGVGSVATPIVTLASPTGEMGARFAGALALVPDIDGDGFAELAVGAPGHDGPTADDDQGLVFLYRGGTTLPSDPDLVIAPPSANELPLFGTLVAGVGDLRGTGLNSLVVTGLRVNIGAPGSTDGELTLLSGVNLDLPLRFSAPEGSDAFGSCAAEARQ